MLPDRSNPRIYRRLFFRFKLHLRFSLSRGSNFAPPIFALCQPTIVGKRELLFGKHHLIFLQKDDVLFAGDQLHHYLP